MTTDREIFLEERIAICMFDGGLSEFEATEVALSEWERYVEIHGGYKKEQAASDVGRRDSERAR